MTDYMPRDTFNKVVAEKDATIARLTAELAEALTERDDAMALFHAADKQMRANKAERDKAIIQAEKAECDLASCGSELTKAWHGIEAAEALLGAAYRAALTDAANRCDTFRGIDHIAQDMDLGIFPQQSERQEAISRAIRAIPTPADLAARLAKEAGV